MHRIRRLHNAYGTERTCFGDDSREDSFPFQPKASRECASQCHISRIISYWGCLFRHSNISSCSVFWRNMSRKSWHLGTMGVEICVSCSICHMCHTMWHHGNYTNSSGTSICLRGAGIWTQPDVPKIPSAKLHLPICSRNGVIFWAPKNPSSETISSNHNPNKTVLVLNLAIALFFVLLSPDRKPLSTKKEKLYVYTVCIHQQACGSERWFRNRVVVCLRTLWFRKVV